MGALDDLMMNAREISPQRDIMRMVAPNYTSVLEGNPNPRQFPTDAPPGKIPSMDDPRFGGSVLEALMLASSMAPAGRAIQGAGMAGRAIPEIMQSAPGLAPMVGKTAAGGATLASILGGTGGDNAEAGDFSWTDPNQGRTKRLEYLDKEIAKEAERKTKSAPGTQKARIDALSAEKAGLQDQQSKEYNSALEQFNKADEATRAEAERKRQAEAPFRERYPNAYQALPIAGWGTAAAAGTLAGAKWPGLKSQLSSAVGGGLESAAFSAGPTVYDAETLPFGSKYQKEAADLIHNPDYWSSRVGPAAGIGAVAGGVGAKWGSMARKPAAAMPQPELPSGGPSSSNTSGATPAGSAPQSPAPSAKAPTPRGPYVTYTMPDGGKVMETPHGWRGINPETGKQTGFIKRPEGPLERLMGEKKSASPEAQTSGGSPLEDLMTPESKAAARSQPYDPAVMVNGKIFRGTNHGDAAERAALSLKKPMDSLKFEDGFIEAGSGDFITRAEAYRRLK